MYPPGPGLRSGIEPLPQAIEPYRRFIPRRETSLSLHPSTWAAFLPPRPLTTSWRPGRELSCSLALEPSHRPRARRPLEPGPTLRGLDARSAGPLAPVSLHPKMLKAMTRGAQKSQIIHRRPSHTLDERILMMHIETRAERDIDQVAASGRVKPTIVAVHGRIFCGASE